MLLSLFTGSTLKPAVFTAGFLFPENEIFLFLAVVFALYLSI